MIKINEKDILKIEDIGFLFKNFYSFSEDTINKISILPKEEDRIGKIVRVHEKNIPGLVESINSYFLKAFQFYSKENNLIFDDYILNNPEYLPFLFWIPGGSIGSHIDSYQDKNGRIIETDISAIIYLTENFEGSDFTFEKEGAQKTKEEDMGPAGFSIIPKTGDLLIFRSNAPHHVNKLISGDRVTVTQGFIKRGKYEF